MLPSGRRLPDKIFGMDLCKKNFIIYLKFKSNHCLSKIQIQNNSVFYLLNLATLL